MRARLEQVGAGPQVASSVKSRGRARRHFRGERLHAWSLRRRSVAPVLGSAAIGHVTVCACGWSGASRRGRPAFPDRRPTGRRSSARWARELPFANDRLFVRLICRPCPGGHRDHHGDQPVAAGFDLRAGRR